MYHLAFPVCPVEGPIEPPVPYSHFLEGAVPKKCSTCEFLFEGECTRAFEQLGRYLNLDHGFCGVPGSTDPVRYENKWMVSKVKVPRKCSTCHFLSVGDVRGFICRKDQHIWGSFPRSLDWGSWEPDGIYVELPFPKVTTRQLYLAAKKRDLVAFIQEYRRANPSTSIQEAREDYQEFLAGLKGGDV